jgi:SPP1 family predicted phage head-tail adaptor
MATGINTVTSAFDRRITIEKAVDSLSAKNKPIKTFSFYKNTFANVYVTSGATQYNENYTQVVTTVFFTIRYDKMLIMIAEFFIKTITTILNL